MPCQQPVRPLPSRGSRSVPNYCDLRRHRLAPRFLPRAGRGTVDAAHTAAGRERNGVRRQGAMANRSGAVRGRATSQGEQPSRRSLGPTCHIRAGDGTMTQVKLADLKALFVKSIEGDSAHVDGHDIAPVDPRLRGSSSSRSPFATGRDLGLCMRYPPQAAGTPSSSPWTRTATTCASSSTATS